MQSPLFRSVKLLGVFVVGVLCATSSVSRAAEAGEGTFETTLGQDFHCAEGGGSFTSTFRFDDKTFTIPYAPRDKSSKQDHLDVNLSVLGEFDATGAISCVPDKGGTFHKVAVNAARDFEWLEVAGEYLDPNPGITAGDPFPFVGKAHCVTTRTDDFKILCEQFDFSFNGLSTALAPDDQGFFRFYAGDFTMRAVQRGHTDPGDGKIPVASIVDGPNGDVPGVEVMFKNGVQAAGDLAVTTLAAAYGGLPTGVEVPVRGVTMIDHGGGPVPFFAGGDERFIEVTTDAGVPSNAVMEVCLPSPLVNGPAGVRAVRVLHGEGPEPFGRAFVDRTSRSDPTARRACARVRSLAKFTVVTTDVCGGGQKRSDGLLTVASGLIGKRTVVVDGLTDCTQYPSNLPAGLRPYCVPDADTTPGQCTASLTVGVNRGGCSQLPPGSSDPYSAAVQTGSYSGVLQRGAMVTNLTPIIGPQIAALSNPRDASIGPVDLILAIQGNRRITTYKLKQQLAGSRPGNVNKLETDKDTLTIQCLNPTRY